MFFRLNSSAKAASDVEYPAYGVTGPTKERLPSPGDRKLAQSAQMYHYQHQKQQMIAMEKWVSICLLDVVILLSLNIIMFWHRFKVCQGLEGRKEMFYLTMHSTHFIYGFMASDIW